MAWIGGWQFPLIRTALELHGDCHIFEIILSTIEESKAAAELIRTWLPAALADGAMKCQPEPEIVGKGLKDIQGAVDRLRKGVSAKKLVVEMA